MESSPSKPDYSPSIDLWLDCGVHGSVPLVQTAPDFAIAKDFCEVPPCAATLLIVVDGRKHPRPVILADGISALSRRISYIATSELPF